MQSDPRSGQYHDSDVPTADEARGMFKLDPTDPGGYRDLFVQEGAAKLAQITDEFRQLLYRCADLKTDVRAAPIPQEIRFVCIR